MREVAFHRSAMFRIAALYSALYVLSLAILLIVLMLATERNVRFQNREDVEQDVRTLTKIYEEQGQEALETNLRLLKGNVEQQRALYLLETATGQLIIGDFPPIPPFEDRQTVHVTISPSQQAGYYVTATRLGDLFLFVGRRTENVRVAQRTLLHSFAWALCAVIPLILLGGFALARRAFRRVDAIDRVMQVFASGDLSQRVPVSGQRDEIDGLAADINGVLGRIEKLFSSLKQVTSDIAHDLRTPLGRLHQRLWDARDRAERGLGNQQQLDQALGDIEDVIATFDALLQIAELDAGARSARFTDVELADVARSIFDTYESVAEDAGQKLVLDISVDALLHGDRRLLTQMLANLVENAIRHTPTNTRISLTVCETDNCPTIIVSDDGPGIPSSEHAQVFQRFYRLDSSRTTPGSGIGLTMVKAIAELHHGTVALSDGKPGLIVMVRFRRI